MSINPFLADAAIAAYFSAFPADGAAAIQAEAKTLLGRGGAANMGSVLAAADAAHLVEKYELGSVRTLMLVLLDQAKAMARPAISDFHVGSVGLERQTGNLVLGCNVEFPGTHLGLTLHGEGFVFTRAFSRGTDIAVIAIGEAHPCAHCRQYLSEFAASRELELIDPLGHTLTMAQLYPWPFDPDYLGERGAVPGVELWPDLDVVVEGDSRIAEALRAAGRKAHSPYSRCPGAVVLELTDGTLVSGSAVESVAFNPTIGPLQAALVDLLAHGFDYADIAHATLGTVVDGAVDYRASTAELLKRVAPQAGLTMVGWAM